MWDDEDLWLEAVVELLVVEDDGLEEVLEAALVEARWLDVDASIDPVVDEVDAMVDDADAPESVDVTVSPPHASRSARRTTPPRMKTPSEPTSMRKMRPLGGGEVKRNLTDTDEDGAWADVDSLGQQHVPLAVHQDPSLPSRRSSRVGSRTSPPASFAARRRALSLGPASVVLASSSVTTRHGSVSSALGTVSSPSPAFESRPQVDRSPA
jgi:hypothetical protein